jgi:hypothetical protein
MNVSIHQKDWESGMGERGRGIRVFYIELGLLLCCCGLVLVPPGHGGVFAETNSDDSYKANSNIVPSDWDAEKGAIVDDFDIIRDCVIYLFPEQFPGEPAFQSVATGLGSMALKEDINTAHEFLEISIEHDIINPSWAAIYGGAPGANAVLLVALPSAVSPIDYEFSGGERDALLARRDLFIQVGSDDLPEGELYGDISCIVEIPPSNDTCATATDVFLDVPVRGTTLSASASGNAYCFPPNGRDRWYSFTAESTTLTTVSLCGSLFDTTLEVFSACPEGGVTAPEDDAVVCNDDFCGRGSQLSFDAVAGSTYLIRVAGYQEDTGDFQLRVSEGTVAAPALLGSVFCTMWNANNLDAVKDATLTLVPLDLDLPFDIAPLTANMNGHYEFPDLPNGRYAVTAVAPGFDTEAWEFEIKNRAIVNVIIPMTSDTPVEPEDTEELRFYVAAHGGNNAQGDGSAQFPWKTISYAMTRIEGLGTADEPVLLKVGAGWYHEHVVFVDNVILRGHAEQGLNAEEQAWYNPVWIEPKRHEILDGDVAVIGAHNTALENVSVSIPTGNAEYPLRENVKLLSIVDESMRVDRVRFDARNAVNSVGVYIEGQDASLSDVTRCVFERSDFGVQVVESSPAVRNSFFKNIRQTAIQVRVDDNKQGEDAPTPNLGNASGDDSGFNTFRNVDIAIDSNNPVQTLAEGNDWGVFTADAVNDLIIGNVEPFPIHVRSGLLSSAIFCAVKDGSSQLPVRNATVSILPSTLEPVTLNTDGVYAFAALDAGQYRISVTAPEYDDERPEERDVDSAETDLVTVNMGGSSLRLTSPNGGERWGQGVDHDIMWVTNGDIPEIKVKLFKNGVFDSWISGPRPNVGSFTWEIPEDLLVADDYTVLVYSAASFSIEDYSNATFSIVEEEESKVPGCAPPSGDGSDPLQWGDLALLVLLLSGLLWHTRKGYVIR